MQNTLLFANSNMYISAITLKNLFSSDISIYMLFLWLFALVAVKVGLSIKLKGVLSFLPFLVAGALFAGAFTVGFLFGTPLFEQLILTVAGALIILTFLSHEEHSGLTKGLANVPKRVSEIDSSVSDNSSNVADNNSNFELTSNSNATVNSNINQKPSNKKIGGKK